MNLPLHIAKRYFFGKKSHNAINIVSGISLTAVVVVSIAFILIMSVFNGFDQLVQTMYNSFYSDLKIEPAEGKTFTLTRDELSKIQGISGIEATAEILEDNALLIYDDQQTAAMVRGVCENFTEVTRLDTMIYDGSYKLVIDGLPRAIVGRGIAYQLGIGLDFMANLKIYVPKRNAKNFRDPLRALTQKTIRPEGIFTTQPEIESKYIIVPLDFARDLFGYSDQISALEIKLTEDTSAEEVKSSIQEIIGSNFQIKTRYEQNELLYKTMKSEKWAIFFILAFVLVIASFNLVGSITMLIIEKKKDINILKSLGATKSTISWIFFSEGMLITTAGAVFGLILGSTICLIQQEFGLVKLQGNGAFIIDHYPVVLEIADIFIVLGTVLAIGAFSSWLPVKVLIKKYAFNQKMP